jgi:hypothetical protein
MSMRFTKTCGAARVADRRGFAPLFYTPRWKRWPSMVPA